VNPPISQIDADFSDPYARAIDRVGFHFLNL